MNTGLNQEKASAQYCTEAFSLILTDDNRAYRPSILTFSDAIRLLTRARMRSLRSPVVTAWMPIHARPPYTIVSIHNSLTCGMTSPSDAPIVLICMKPSTPLLLGRIWPNI